MSPNSGLAGLAALLAMGTTLIRGTTVFDVVNGAIPRTTGKLPAIIVENAVVIPGSRAVSKGTGQYWGLSLDAGVIVKYSEKTESEHGARRPAAAMRYPALEQFGKLVI